MRRILFLRTAQIYMQQCTQSCFFCHQWDQTYSSISNQVGPGVQLRVHIVQVPFERFTLQPFSEFLPLSDISNVNAMILQITDYNMGWCVGYVWFQKDISWTFTVLAVKFSLLCWSQSEENLNLVTPAAWTPLYYFFLYFRQHFLDYSVTKLLMNY